jgi:hypothetical protein
MVPDGPLADFLRTEQAAPAGADTPAEASTRDLLRRFPIVSKTLPNQDRFTPDELAEMDRLKQQMCELLLQTDALIHRIDARRAAEVES